MAAAVIFNNRTSLTVSVAPPSADADGVEMVGSGVTAVVHKLETANENEDGACLRPTCCLWGLADGPASGRSD